MEGAAQILTGPVRQLVSEEFQQLRAVGGEVAQLRDELATMNAVLRMQSEADDGAVDHFVREWMKQVRELAYDAEDCVDLYVFRIRCRPSDGYLAWFKRLLTTLSPRRRLAGDIKALRARAITISERHARYGVNREALRRSPSLAAPPAAAAPARHELRPANDANQFVNTSDQVNTLVERVKVVNERDMKLRVFSIVGFGGLGKTMLAMEVCRQLEPEFQRQAQVSVSQAFDARKDMVVLLKRVLQQIMKVKADNEKGVKEEDILGRIDGMNVDELAEELKNHLKDKRYLIVIDDVWTTSAWNAIRSKLPDNNCGSKVIVTTRLETVAKACSESDHIHHVEPLNDQDSKKLFLSRAFGPDSCPKALEVEMGKILKKCGGMPLAIVSIASLLRSYRSPESIDMWQRVGRSIGSQMEINPTLEGMSQILTLSYDHLTYHLKDCMMYLSVFPEDYEIDKQRLLHRWIAEGLVPEKRGLTLMEVAETFFDELIGRSMIHPAATINNYNHKVEWCKVHDMMLEVMVSRSMEANFVSLLGGQYEGMSYDIIRRLSIHRGDKHEPKNPGSKRSAVGTSINVQHVRSLSIFELQGHGLLDRLGEFTLLRVLDMEGCKGVKNKHVMHICRMYLLRFLSLRGTDIDEMPPQIGELEHLQTLDVYETLLDALPDSVTKLGKLECLLFVNRKEWYTMWKAPRGISKMKALREMDKVVIEDPEVAREIRDLEHLQGMLIYLDNTFEHHVEVCQELAKTLEKAYSLRSLNVGEITDFGDNLLDYLIDLHSPPQNLRYLRFAGRMRKFPDWVGLLTHLTEFCMSWTRLVGDQLFDVLSKLPNLQRVRLEICFYNGAELVARTSHIFPALKDLSVVSENPKVFRFEQGSMTKLEKLHLGFGDEEKTIVGVEHLTNLGEVQLTGKKHNSAMDHALVELKAEAEKRPKSKQFIVGVKYD